MYVKVRMDSRRSRNTRLVFCTTGILLRQLHGDPDLKEVRVYVYVCLCVFVSVSVPMCMCLSCLVLSCPAALLYIVYRNCMFMV